MPLRAVCSARPPHETVQTVVPATLPPPPGRVCVACSVPTLFNGDVADSSYPFPPDRFDEEADTVSFHGAHRAEEPFWRQNLVYIVIIAVALLTLIVLLFLIGGMGGNKDSRTPAPTTTTSEAPAKPSEKPEKEKAPEADKSTPVLVVNAGGIKGLAGSWKGTLEGDGWQKVDVETAKEKREEAVVYYRDEADKVTAEALAKTVGAKAERSDEHEARITFFAVTEPGGGEGNGDNGDDNGGE